MLFTTFTFTVFFIIVLSLWWTIIPKKENYRKVSLIIFSLIFYGWADLRWLINLTLIGLFTGFIINYLYSLRDKPKQFKLVGILSTIVLLTQLIVWKYVPWAVMSWNELSFINDKYFITPPEWLYPVGLSFFTFHSLSLIFSVWLEKKKPLSVIESFAHVSFFPALLAGPVLRYNDINYRWKEPWNWKNVDWSAGIFRIMLGMTFKWVFATKAAEWADPAFQGMTDNAIDTWLSVHAYSLQIFFDFAGYSHIALGVAILLGWKLPENFTQPYLSKSVQDFWRNWHRSLSFFFRDYVYIHLLGGSKNKSQYRILLNGFFTMVLSGIWHGASFVFILWGIWHGICLAINHLFKLFSPFKIPVIISWFITFEAVTWGWVWFRSSDLDNAIQVFNSAFDFSNFRETILNYNLDQSVILWILAMVTLILFEKSILNFIYKINNKIDVEFKGKGISLTAGTFVLSAWAYLIMYLGPIGVPAFIYNAF